jgi:hypothetical protein
MNCGVYFEQYITDKFNKPKTLIELSRDVLKFNVHGDSQENYTMHTTF